MRLKCENIRDAVKSLVAAVWVTFSVCSLGVHGQEGKKNTHFYEAFDEISYVTLIYLATSFPGSCS